MRILAIGALMVLAALPAGAQTVPPEERSPGADLPKEKRLPTLPLCSNVCSNQAPCDMRCAAPDNPWTTCGVYSGGGCCRPHWVTEVNGYYVASPRDGNEKTEITPDGPVCHLGERAYRQQQDTNDCCANPPCERYRCEPLLDYNPSGTPLPGCCTGDCREGWIYPWADGCDETWTSGHRN